MSLRGVYAVSKLAIEALSEALAQKVRAFNSHVAIVEPGIINTAMAQRVGVAAPPAVYLAAPPFSPQC